MTQAQTVLLRRLRRLLQAPACLLALGFSLPAAAVGPEAPVDFLDVYAAKGFVLMVIEPAQVVDVELTRVIHQDGEPIVREKVEWQRLRMIEYTAPITRPEHFVYSNPREKKVVVTPKPLRLPAVDTAQPRSDLKLADASSRVIVLSDKPPRRIGVLIPMESPSQADLKDGLYAEKFVARVKLAGESDKSKPLSMLRWSHFAMKERKPRFISQAEYSRLVDPPVSGLGSDGKKISLNLGRDVKADVPADKTPLSFSVPLQVPKAALAAERDDSRPCDARTSKLCNEAQER